MYVYMCIHIYIYGPGIVRGTLRSPGPGPFHPPRSCQRDTPSMQALATTSGNRNCSPPLIRCSEAYSPKGLLLRRTFLFSQPPECHRYGRFAQEEFVC